MSIQELVRRDLIHREQLGRARYGTSLHAYNGRSAILDAYEEALDLCCYLRQVIEELTIDSQAGNPPPTTTGKNKCGPSCECLDDAIPEYGK